MAREKQQSLFTDLPQTARPLRFKTQQRPLWTHNKAKLIERYLFYFVLVTKHGAYIDGFAAPQRRNNPDACSCKMVLESKPQFLREFWLCDLRSEGVDALRQIAGSVPRPRNRSIDIVQGDFNVKVHEILRDCRIGENTASFCLLDQRTFECKWETVKTLAQFKSEGHKIELFYFLATGWLDRSIAGVTKNKDLLREWWGRDDWIKLRGMNGHVRANLVADRFKSELGYVHAYPFPIYSRTHGGRVMYHMIHATDHPEAPKLMNRAYANATKTREPMKQLEMELQALMGSQTPAKD